jgi:Ca2+/Na+ antiporter
MQVVMVVVLYILFLFYIYRYNNPRRNKFHQDICCVIFLMPDGVHESDLVCQSSDAEADLDTCLESNDEQVISSLITIEPKNDKESNLRCVTFVLYLAV